MSARRVVAAAAVALLAAACGGTAASAPSQTRSPVVAAPSPTPTATPAPTPTATPCATIYEPWGDSTGVPPVTDLYVQATPIIVIGTIVSDDGAHYNTPDGSRPAEGPRWGDGIYRAATVGDLEAIRGTVGSRTISVRMIGGEIGCDRIRPEVEILTPSVGGRYVLLLSADPPHGADVFALWPVTGDGVHTVSGEMTIARLRSLAAALPCEGSTQCDETSLP